MSDPQTILSRLTAITTVPVITIDDAAKAVDLAGALVEGGIPAIEVTLRTPAAIDAISSIAASGLDIVLGAGSVTSEQNIADAVTAGADFLVTPATPQALVPALQSCGRLVLPGVSTPSEALGLYLAGFPVLKIFPAATLGGPAYIASLKAPLSELRVMPSGGITLENVADYLAPANVVAVGVSWLAPPDCQAMNDWDMVRRNCEALRAKLDRD